MEDAALSTLKEIGLTDYEARAYRALLDLGVATASRISEYANIPYSKIYEVLNSLEKKGWIETQAERPRKYYPKPPIEGLEVTRINLENKIRTWEKTVKEALQPLYERRELRERPDIWILRGRNTALAKIREMFEKATQEIMIAAPHIAINFIEAAIRSISKSSEPGLRIFVLFPDKVNRRVLSRIIRVAEVRVRDNLFGGGIIIDGREAILILGEERHSLVIWSDHSGLVKFAREYFKSLWESASQIT